MTLLTSPTPEHRIVAQRPVITAGKSLTVSTIRLRRGHYETCVFDDSADKRHSGMSLGGFVIDLIPLGAGTRDEAMENHREALHAARTEQPQTLRRA